MFVFILFVFFLSGLTSLVLETLWVRMMVLVFGGTTLAVVTILTAFMGGLALGSYLMSRWGHSLKRPLVVYGLLEGIVAISALLLPLGLPWVASITASLSMTQTPLLLAFVRFCLSLLLLLIPTTCMGATLPVLSQYLARRSEQLRADVGLLYSMNTLGAVVGAFSGGFLLLPLLGNAATLTWVATILLVLANTMLIIGRRETASPIPHRPQPSTQAAQDGPESEALGPAVFAIIGVTGMLAMVCQVIWSRSLALAIGSSSYGFSLILTIFLLGLALGAFWGSWYVRHHSATPQVWALVIAATGVAVSLGSLIIGRLPLWFGMLVRWLGLYKSTTALVFYSTKALVISIPLLLPCFLMGCFFPLALGIVNERSQTIGRDVGRLYAANTLGSIIGSGFCGFVLIPLLGMQASLALVVSLYMLSSILLLSKTEQGAARRIVLFAALAFGVWFFPKWDIATMNGGFFRFSLYKTHTLKQLQQPGKLLFYKEGLSANVSVQRSGRHLFLKINGKVDASSSGDSPTQISIGALPLIHHPAPKKVAVVGWGSGMTTGAALLFPIKTLDALELEPAVVEGARLFSKWNFRPEKDKRLHIIYNDARNHFATTSSKYDVIISQPSNPWLSGIANLFTVDFFKQVSSRLNKGGVFCQWVQAYELSNENISSIFRSVLKVFPHVLLFKSNQTLEDIIVLASHHNIRVELSKLKRLFKSPRYRMMLARMKVYSPDALLERVLLDEKGLRKMLKQEKSYLNTDDHNQLEFKSPLDLLKSQIKHKDDNFNTGFTSWERAPLQYVFDGDKRVTPKTHPKLWRSMILRFAHQGELQTSLRFYKELKASQPMYPALKRLRLIIRHLTAPPHQLRHKSKAKRYQTLAKRFLRAPQATCKRDILPITRLPQFEKRLNADDWYLIGKCFLLFEKYPDATYSFFQMLRPTKKPTAAPVARATSRPNTHQAATRPTSQPALRTTTRPTSQPSSQPTTRSTLP